MQSALPRWLRLAWLFLAPIGFLFAARIAWEKTVWTWSRGPQAVGFSLMPVHPFFSVALPMSEPIAPVKAADVYFDGVEQRLMILAADLDEGVCSSTSLR
jgi:hypothetical protein